MEEGRTLENGVNIVSTTSLSGGRKGGNEKWGRVYGVEGASGGNRKVNVSSEGKTETLSLADQRLVWRGMSDV